MTVRKIATLTAVVLMGLGLTITPAHAAGGQVHLYHNSNYANYMYSALTSEMENCTNQLDGYEIKSLQNGSAWRIRIYDNENCWGDYRTVASNGVENSFPFWGNSKRRIAP